MAERAVIYQIYPRSFQDTNGDGVGDLAGILQRVDYLAWLGIDAVWLTPVFPSPMADSSATTSSDYTAIDPLFGIMADFDALLHAAHARGLRVLLDFVPNHTSDQHPWFRESRASRTNQNATGTSGATARPAADRPTTGFRIRRLRVGIRRTTGQYYLHSFLCAAGPQLASPGGARGHA